MLLQLEDVVDCLLALYPEFEIVFLFDNSQGHARKRNGGLNALYMLKKYGGAQPAMRDTTVLSETGFLGPFSPVLSVGDTHSLKLKSEDSGPWYLSLKENTGKRKRVEQSKAMLVDTLLEAGVVLQQQRNHTKTEMIDFAKTTVLTFMKTESLSF